MTHTTESPQDHYNIYFGLALVMCVLTTLLGLGLGTPFGSALFSLSLHIYLGICSNGLVESIPLCLKKERDKNYKFTKRNYVHSFKQSLVYMICIYSNKVRYAIFTD